MLVTVKGKFDRHRRSFSFPASSKEAAAEEALKLAAFYAKGSGVYGPMVWKYGELSMCTIHDTAWTVIRDERPVLRVVS